MNRIIRLTLVATGIVGLTVAVLAQMLHSTARTPLTLTYRHLDEKGREMSREALSYMANGSRALLAYQGDPVRATREYYDLANGYFVSVDPMTRMYMKETISRARADGLGAIPGGCEAALQPQMGDIVHCDEAATETRFGRRVMRATVSRQESDGTTLTEDVLLDPGLNWLPLDRVRRKGGVVVGRVEAISLQIGTPDPALFSVPDGYARADKPSTYLKALNAARGIEAPVYEKIDEQVSKGRQLPIP